jgi:hypothetical protein
MLGHFMSDSTGMMTKVLFTDFVVCPTEPLVKGATQPATVKQIHHPRVLTEDQWVVRYWHH